MKVNSNSFYAQNGNKVIDFEESYKAKNTCKFLERLSEKKYEIILISYLYWKNQNQILQKLRSKRQNN